MSIFSLCSPALLYLIIGIITIVTMIYLKTDMKIVAMKALLVAIWTWFLNFLCFKGHIGISWFLVIIPMVVFALCIIVVSNIMGCMKDQNKEMFSDVDCSRYKNKNNPACVDYCKSINCKDTKNKNNYCCHDCDLEPWHPSCPVDCDMNPTDYRCPPDCINNPSHYRC
jgi:hypothetical protein